MFLALAGAILVGLPGLLLGVWFSWLTHRKFLRGGAMLVARTWLLCILLIAGGLTALGAPFVKSGYGLAYNSFVDFCVLAVAGGIPSAVIAVVVSCLTLWMEDRHDEYGSDANFPVLPVVIGTLAGILAGVAVALPLSMRVMDAFW